MVKTHQSGKHGLARVVVQARNHFSPIWLIPLMALTIGGWLGFRAIHDRGPTITIRFDLATGLEAGKTKIRYRDVDIGIVERVAIDRNPAHVQVTARLDKRAQSFLTQSARFWVVRARVSTSKISGLGTLFSGAYIALSPGQENDEPAREFIGLETPPMLTEGLPGRHFRLRAQRLGSLDVGASVFYRQIAVGRVVSYTLSETGDELLLRVFIEAPHDKRISADTRFWSAAGIDLTLDAAGLKIDTESLETILSGGISFENIESQEVEEEAKSDTVFTLYPDHRSIFEREYSLKQRFVLYFNESVRGLVPGAPVELRGIRIGKVISVSLDLDAQKMEFRTPVVIELEPERIEITRGEKMHPETMEAQLKKLGLRGQLKMANLLTGQLAISLDIGATPPPVAAKTINSSPYPELPTLPTSLEEFTASIGRFLKTLERLPIEEIGNRLNGNLKGLEATLSEVRGLMAELKGNLAPAASTTLGGINSLVGELKNNLAPAATTAMGEVSGLAGELRGNLSPTAISTLQELQHTLLALQQNYGHDSRLSQETRQTLGEIGKAAASIRNLTDYLERHPEALLLGKKGEKP